MQRDDNLQIGAAFSGYDNKPHLLIESLSSSPMIPVWLDLVYYAEQESIAFIYNADQIADRPEAFEIYTPDVRYTGKIEMVPDGGTGFPIMSIVFNADDIRSLLETEDVFIRIKTAEDTYFVELKDAFIFLSLIAQIDRAIDYSTVGTANYRNAKIIP